MRFWVILMNKKILTFLMILIIFIVGVIFYTQYDKEGGLDENYQEEAGVSGGIAYYPPDSGMYESYLEDSKVYTSKLGFSFQYPKYLYVMEDPEPGIPERLFIIDPLAKDDYYGIVISTAINDENMTPLEWLGSPASGANLPDQGYVNVLKINGQEGIAIENGGWVVVNTPDDKYRLSIALLPGKDDKFLFTEIGMILSSLKFDR